MPVDFLRVPPRDEVPDVSRPSISAWALLLCLMLAGSAAAAVFVWPAGKPDSMSFWFCAVYFPILAWSFLLSCRFAYAYGCVSTALATNRTSDAIETQCHESSSRPLAVLGHVWRFSSSDGENDVDALIDGKTKLRPVSSQAARNTDVIARWLDVPGRQFHAGNALTEHARQTAVCEWLLNQLVHDLAHQFPELPASLSLSVDLCIDSVLNAETVGERVLSLLKDKFRTSCVDINSPKRVFSLFHVDSWFDDIRSDRIKLLVAVQLRSATSEILGDGVAEAGSMLLVSTPSVARKMGEVSPLCIHRPARGVAQRVADTLEFAIRWGRVSFDKIGTTWHTCLAEETARIFRSSCRFGRGMGTVDLDTTVGHAGVASAWLATTLAATNAALTNESQLVIAQEGNETLALVCKKQT